MYFWSIHSHTELVIVRRQLIVLDLLRFTQQQMVEGKPALMHHLVLQNVSATVTERRREN